MRRQTKTLMALASVCLLMAGLGVAVVGSEEAEAAGTAEGRTYYVGETIDSIKLLPGSSVSGSIPGVTLACVVEGSPFIYASGTFTTAGTYMLTSNQDWNIVIVVRPGYLITLDPNGGSFSGGLTEPTSSYVMKGQEYGTMLTPTREGYQFSGWYYTEWDGAITGPVGSNWTAYMDLTMWAQWTPLVEIPYAAPTGSTVANTSWSYSPTTEPGVTVTVSGVNWLSVAGTNIFGTPPAAGEYTITVDMSKAGYHDRTETFTLNVVSMLAIVNSPSAGIVVYLV
ncbi:MAG: hypothetical protein EOM93_05370 [Gammaproteobacteria bacterium]|nr:hypothetical protein [Gammaproteobacteria bacterium]